MMAQVMHLDSKSDYIDKFYPTGRPLGENGMVTEQLFVSRTESLMQASQRTDEEMQAAITSSTSYGVDEKIKLNKLASEQTRRTATAAAAHDAEVEVLLSNAPNTPQTLIDDEPAAALETAPAPPRYEAIFPNDTHYAAAHEADVEELLSRAPNAPQTQIGDEPAPAPAQPTAAAPQSAAASAWKAPTPPTATAQAQGVQAGQHRAPAATAAQAPAQPAAASSAKPRSEAVFPADLRAPVAPPTKQAPAPPQKVAVSLDGIGAAKTPISDTEALGLKFKEEKDKHKPMSPAAASALTADAFADDEPVPDRVRKDVSSEFTRSKPPAAQKAPEPQKEKQPEPQKEKQSEPQISKHSRGK
jgi:hypothetical protein